VFKLITTAGLAFSLILMSITPAASIPAPSDPPAVEATALTWSHAPKARKLDSTLIKKLRVRDHTAAVRKIKVKLVSRPSRTLWTSTRYTTNVSMTWVIKDPRNVAKRFRVCVDEPLIDESRCITRDLKTINKPRGDFWVRRIPGGWRVFTAPYYRPRSPAQCYSHEYYRPRVIWTIRVVDPRNGRNAASARFSWTVRCAG
jgi:hypothetical protein